MNYSKLVQIFIIIAFIGGLGFYVNIKRRASTGDNSPNFKTTLINGEPFELDKLKGGFIVLDFWATWCAPCRKEIPQLKEFHAKYENDLTIVSIALEKDRTALMNNLDVFDLPWKHQVVEENSLVILSDIAQLYGVSEIPTMILIAPDGEILIKGSLTEINDYFE